MLQANDGCACRRAETFAGTDRRHHRESGKDLLGEGGQPVDETGHRGCAVPSPGIRAGPLEPSRPCPRVFGEVRRCGKDEGAYRPFRAQDDPLPRLPPEDTGRGGLHPFRGNRHAGADERFPGLCGERTSAAAGISRLLRSPHAHQPPSQVTLRHDRHQHHEPFLHVPALVQENEVFRQRSLCVYGCKEPTYGDPFYLTSEERNVLYDADLSDCPKLAVIRDIFVFHCYVGCRVGDLYRLTRTTSRTAFWNTCRRRQKVPGKDRQVPLHEKALKILERYDAGADRLFPVQADTHLQPRHTGTAETLRHRPYGDHP